MSESAVSVGDDRWWSCFADQSETISLYFRKRQYRKRSCREGEETRESQMRSFVLQSLSGYFKIFANPALLAFSTAFCWRSFRLPLRQCLLLLPSARSTFEPYIFIRINSPVSVDRRIFIFRFHFCARWGTEPYVARLFFCKDSAAPRRRAERGARYAREGRSCGSW
jgi:hypothetical protein